MTPKFEITPETAYQQLYVENEWRKQQMLVLAQRVANLMAELELAKSSPEAVDISA